MSKPKLTHAQLLAIAKKEEESRIKDLLEQCGMLCEAIQMTCETTLRDEERKSMAVYYDAERQKKAREKKLAIQS